MRLQERSAPYTEFDAELVTDHPQSVPGPLALRRKDTSGYIAIRDILIFDDRVYDILDATEKEKQRLNENGVMLF